MNVFFYCMQYGRNISSGILKCHFKSQLRCYTLVNFLGKLFCILQTPWKISGKKSWKTLDFKNYKGVRTQNFVLGSKMYMNLISQVICFITVLSFLFAALIMLRGGNMRFQSAFFLFGSYLLNLSSNFTKTLIFES